MDSTQKVEDSGENREQDMCGHTQMMVRRKISELCYSPPDPVSKTCKKKSVG